MLVHTLTSEDASIESLDYSQVKKINVLRCLSVNLHSLIEFIDPFYRYEICNNPKRILTKPSKGVHNNGIDNASYDYILAVGDHFGQEEGRRFIILDLLGQGTFGQVVKCQNVSTGEIVAIKIIKNQTAYFNQSMMEVTILEMLNSSKYTDHERAHITKMKDTFVYKKHLCIIFELLSLNIFELLKQNQFKGFSHQLIRIFLQQILSALCLLNDAKIVHCDLKPENILLQSMDSAFIKVIDFGSACHEQHTVYTYIQSRFYRSPEVILGLPYSSSIDMWSLGCIAAELFLGIPIFPGTSNYDQLSRIIECVGLPPTYMLEVGRNTLLYFDKMPSQVGYVLKTKEQYEADMILSNPHQSQNVHQKPPKRYFSHVKLEDIILSYPMKTSDSLTQEEIDQEMMNRKSLLDFIKNLLNMNPIERWSPQQAKLHPYILGEPWKGPFVPPGPACVSPISTFHRPPLFTNSQFHSYHARPRSSTINSQLYNIPPNLERITNVVTKDSYSSLRSIPGSSLYQFSKGNYPGQLDVTAPNTLERLPRNRMNTNQVFWPTSITDFNPYFKLSKKVTSSDVEPEEEVLVSSAQAWLNCQPHFHSAPNAFNFANQRRLSNPAGIMGLSGDNGTKRPINGNNFVGSGSRRYCPNGFAIHQPSTQSPTSKLK